MSIVYEGKLKIVLDNVSSHSRVDGKNLPLWAPLVLWALLLLLALYHHGLFRFCVAILTPIEGFHCPMGALSPAYPTPVAGFWVVCAGCVRMHQ